MTIRLFIDCTDTYFSGLNTGIQRVVRGFATNAPAQGPQFGIQCLPTVFQDQRIVALDPAEMRSVRIPRISLRSRLNSLYLAWSRSLAAHIPMPTLKHFLLAPRTQFGLARLLFAPVELLLWRRSRYLTAADNTLMLQAGDLLFLPDASWSGNAFDRLLYYKDSGVRLIFLVHDIIPLTHPEFYQSEHTKRFSQWLSRVVEIADFLIYNSQFTRRSVEEYWHQHGTSALPPSEVVYLGHDLQHPHYRQDTIKHTRLRKTLSTPMPTFLCIGTLEPRKNHATMLTAFEHLWAESYQVILVIIGRAGWLCDDLLTRIRHHSELGRRLFWFSDIGDADLALSYRKMTALIFPSFIEGFGLPLVEALSQGLPIIASDIPVFREIADGYGRFFQPSNAHALANCLKGHLAAQSPTASLHFSWPSWEESTQRLLTILNALPHKESP